MSQQEPQEQRDYPPCDADDEMYNLIRAKYGLIYVVTWEERRAIKSLEKICDKQEIMYQGVQVWDTASGLVTSKKGIPVEDAANLKTPDGILDYISRKAEAAKEKKSAAKISKGPIYVLCDLFRYLEDARLFPDTERRLRALTLKLRKTSIHVVVISPVLQLPTALEKTFAVVDYPLPGMGQLDVLIERATAKLVEIGRLDANTQVPVESVVRALQGLTIQEAEDALAKSIVTKDNFDIPTLLEFKRQIIRKGETLDYIVAAEGMDDVGGLRGVKEWIGLRKEAFSEKARTYGLPQPKGIFMLGVQGSGKSLCAKAIAKELNVPLLKLSMGRMFGSHIGESEHRMRRALGMAEAVAPCVLLVDEVDKNLAGGASAAYSGDSGTTKRVVASLLDWMQEKKSPVFVVACANSLAGVPPEFLRKGRFDEMFFVDLPDAEERMKIFEIHLSKKPRCRDPKTYDLQKLAQETEGFSGAEIEGVIIDAMYTGFAAGREFDTADITAAIEICVPLSKVAKEMIDELRESARDRMKWAGKPLFKGSGTDQEDDRFDV